MLSRCASTMARRCTASAAHRFCGGGAASHAFAPAAAAAARMSSAYPPLQQRGLTTVRDAATADDALRFSGYSEIDFTVPEDAPVYDAVQKFAAFNIGCLVTVDTAGTYILVLYLSLLRDSHAHIILLRYHTYSYFTSSACIMHRMCMLHMISLRSAFHCTCIQVRIEIEQTPNSRLHFVFFPSLPTE